MKLVSSLRHDIDDPAALEEFGRLLRFSALVFDDDDKSPGFESGHISGDMAVFQSLDAAEHAFELASSNLTKAADSLSERDDEGMVGLFMVPDTGFLVLAATNGMGFETGLETTEADHYREAMTNIMWERVAEVIEA